MTQNEHNASGSGSLLGAGPAQSRRAADWLSRYATILLLLLLGLVFAVTTPNFATSRNFSSLLLSQAVVGVMALAALMPLIVAEFDLSLGFLLGFLAMLGAYLGGNGSPTWIVIAAMLAGGVIVGLVNGFLAIRLRISAFIATLAVGTILFGATQGLSGGTVLYNGIPTLLLAIGSDTLFGISISVWLTLLVAAICWYCLEHTATGRRLYAIGGSERVAFLVGIRTNRLKIGAFAVAGLLVGVAALFSLGQAGAATPGYGPDLLLPAYAAAFLGVTTYRPGVYNVPGTMIAIMLLAIGFNGLSLLGVPFWVQPLFNGGVLLAAVLVARSEKSRLTR